MGATVAVALNGIQFKGKALNIARPKAYSGPPVKRSQLLNLSLKDLVASEGAAAAAAAALPQSATSGEIASTSSAPQNSNGTPVQLSGIPSSMNQQSVFDLLQQFGGALHSLNLAGGAGEHLGHGTAVYVDHASAVEAVGFSPLLGFIEVKLSDGASPATTAPPAATTSVTEEAQPQEPPAKRVRRTRFDPEPVEPQAQATSVDEDIEDLGPFEAALAKRTQKPPAATAPAAVAAPAETFDLGPFEAVLPPSRPPAAPAARVAAPDVDVDLGPFEAVLPPAKAAPAPEPEDATDDDLDLGVFEAVLPPAKTAAAPPSAPEDLGPFESILPSARKAPAPVAEVEEDDLGPFAAAIQGFEQRH